MSVNPPEGSLSVPRPSSALAQLYDDENGRLRRLNIPSLVRIPLASALAFTVGLGLGAAQGSKMAGLRFRAEHAHKLPTTTVGWYMYHKSKNYHSAFGGLREGVKMGFKVSVWTTAMFGIENMLDSSRHDADIINTLLASMTVAGLFSAYNRFSLPMTFRTAKASVYAGLLYGGLQDVVGIIRGRPIGYVDYVKARLTS